MRGDRLRKVREEQDYSQEQLAEYLNIGQQQIWRYENEKSKPSSDILTKIATFLNVSTDYLLGLTDNPKGYIEVELTPDEQKVLAAYRRGDIRAIILLTPDKPPKASNE
jgi:transcriptional regulator with XRE-family HTH domain